MSAPAPITAPPAPPTASPAVWVIHVDGTAVPSPGALGVGVVLLAPDGARHEVSRALDARGCNNEAEARAVVTALDEAARLGARHLRLHSDSAVVVDALRGRRQTTVERLRLVFADIRSRLAAFDTVDVALVGRRHNADADRLARAALGLSDKVVRCRWRRGRGR